MDRRIEDVDVDQGVFIVMLRPGFAHSDANSDAACHTFGADTKDEIKREMKSVRPCRCDECRALLRATKKEPV